jgi:hypothetical protein
MTARSGWCGRGSRSSRRFARLIPTVGAALGRRDYRGVTKAGLPASGQPEVEIDDVTRGRHRARLLRPHAAVERALADSVLAQTPNGEVESPTGRGSQLVC